MKAGDPTVRLMVNINLVDDLLLFQRFAKGKSIVDVASLNLTFSGTPI